MSSSAKTRRFWIRSASVALALAVPATVVAATVRFGGQEVLTAAKLNALSDRTLDKSLVYPAPAGTSAMLAQFQAGTAISTCTGTADILLNCSCLALPGSRALDLRIINVTGNDVPGTASACGCAAENAGSNPNQLTAQALCINLPE